ncbi:MAG: ABC transporter permease [Conexibacter sp.]
MSDIPAVLDAAAPPSRARLVRLRHHVPPTIALAMALLAGVVVCAIVGPALIGIDPDAQNLGAALAKPSDAHRLGTDDLGRDVLARTIAGARNGLLGPAAVALGAMAIGNVLGLLAGYLGGAVDALVMRWVDLMYALPALLVAIVVVGVVGGGYGVALVLLIVLFSPYDTRVVRGAALGQRALPYVEAARASGLPSWRIMARHIWPAILPIVVANTLLSFALALVALSALSFLGLGAAPGVPEWGRMLAENRTLLFDNPLSALAPGLALVLTAICVNLVGEWAREALTARRRVP